MPLVAVSVLVEVLLEKFDEILEGPEGCQGLAVVVVVESTYLGVFYDPGNLAEIVGDAVLAGLF